MNPYQLSARRSIYIDCRHLDGSGIGSYINNLVKELYAINPDIPLKLLSQSHNIDTLKNTNEFPSIPYNTSIYSISEQFKWISKTFPYGLLHVPHYNAPLFYPGKLIVTVHDVCHQAMRQYFPGFLKRTYSGPFLKQILRKADKIITVSNFSKEEIVKYYHINPEKIKVIYNGVDPTFHRVPKSISDQVIKKHNLPSKYFLYLGNVKPHKNILGLIDSYKRALSLQPNLPPLVILGKYKNLLTGIPNIKNLMLSESFNKKIIFTGYLPGEDIPAIYSRASLFLFPSFYEGFGLPILEAMACGTPVIASNCTSIPEVAENAAVLVNPYSSEELANAIINVYEDINLQKVLINRGFEQIKKFSWKQSAKEHIKLYKEVLEPQPHTRYPSVYVPPLKRNILFLDQFGDRIGGGQVILLDILEKFRKSNKWNVFVCVPNEGIFTDILKKRGFNYWCIETGKHSVKANPILDIFRYITSSVKSTHLLGKKLKEHHIDGVYCNGGRTFLTGSFLSVRFHIPIFWHLHLMLGKRQKKAVTSLGLLKGVKSIISVSNTLKRQYTNDHIIPKIKTVCNWVAPKLLTTPLTKRTASFSQNISVGVVGLISLEKGQLAVLESLAQSYFVLPITLRFYGSFSQKKSGFRDTFEEKVESLRSKGWKIEIMGFETDTLKIYDQLDILLIPSLVEESFGLTAIEAMAREVIVISNRSGALPEIIRNEQNGFLFDIMELTQLPTLLNKIANNHFDIQKIRNNGLNSVHMHYNPHNQLDTLYHTVNQHFVL